MFGLLYALFMGGACIVDDVKKDIDNSEAIQQSLNGFDGVTFGTKGRKYYKGQLASYQTVNGHNCIVSKDGRILRDYDQEKIDANNEKNRKNWDEAIQEARDNDWEYFKFTRLYKTMEFKDRPSGWYELDSYRRIHTYTDKDYKGDDGNIYFYRNPKHFKCYDYLLGSIEKIKLNDYGVIKCGYSWLPNYKDCVEISEEEWKFFGNKGYDWEMHSDRRDK